VLRYWNCKGYGEPGQKSHPAASTMTENIENSAVPKGPWGTRSLIWVAIRRAGRRSDPGSAVAARSKTCGVSVDRWFGWTKRDLLHVLVLSLAVGLLAGCHTDPNLSKRKYLASGDRYSAQGKYRAAVIQYQNSLKADKNFPDAHFALANTYMHLKEYGSAFQEYSRTVELEPSNYQARIDLGNLLVAGNKLDQAQTQARAVLAAQPNNSDAHALLSAIAIKRGDETRALTEIRLALQLAPKQSTFYDDLARLEMRDPSQVVDAESNLKQAIAYDPKSVNAKLLLSNYYLSTNRLAEAEQVSWQAIATDSKSIAARKNLAAVYIREGEVPKAEQVLRQASHDLSANPQGVRILADYFATSNQLTKARNEFASLVSQFPKNLDLQKGYLRVLIQIKDYATAQSVVNRLMKEDPTDPEVVALNGIVLLSKGKVAEAVSALQSGAKTFPHDGFMQYWLGMAALANGTPALAQQSFQSAVEIEPTAVDALGQLAQIAESEGNADLLSGVAAKSIAALPGYANGYVWRANAEMNQKAFDKAESDLKTAMKLAPQNARACFLLGELRFAQKNFKEGKALLEQSLEYDPNQLDAVRLLVSYDLYMKQPAEAFTLVNAEVQKSPKNSRLLDVLTELQMHQAQFPQAAATAQRAMQLDPSDPEAITLFARIAVQQGQTATAITAWRQWTVAHPNDANALAVLGTLEESSGNPQVAQADYQRSLQMEPQQPLAANNLAYMILQNGGDVEQAMALALIARRAMPHSPNTADTLALAYYKKGNYDLARSLLENALKMEPNNASMEYHLGMVYARLRDGKDAAIHLKKAIVLGHGTTTASDAEKELQKIG
jgi:tetratricopeptide (TPR) repeat protein